MHFGPNITEQLGRARADLRMGVPVVLTGTPSVVVFPTETLTEDKFQNLLALGSLTLAITARRAESLKTFIMDGDIARLSIPKGQSLSWIKAVADPSQDLNSPLKGPFQGIWDGTPAPARGAIQLIKSAQLLPAAILCEIKDALAFAATHNLTTLSYEAAQTRLQQTNMLSDIVSARLPTTAASQGRLHVFRPNNGSDEHYAMEIGRPNRRESVLVRLHSACFTGDVMGSLKCDCGPQLRAALTEMGAQNSGVLLYLNQEGRGIGLANKMRAYSLQDQGYDTVEANHRLGFEDDERDFRLGATILKDMGIDTIRLLTNNPAKVAMMEKQGIKVSERVPLSVGRNTTNAGYLDTKARKSGHVL